VPMSPRCTARHAVRAGTLSTTPPSVSRSRSLVSRRLSTRSI
jgi:hypothetical protein